MVCTWTTDLLSCRQQPIVLCAAFESFAEGTTYLLLLANSFCFPMLYLEKEIRCWHGGLRMGSVEVHKETLLKKSFLARRYEYIFGVYRSRRRDSKWIDIRACECCRDVFGDNAVVGDLRWGGTFGVDADFVARENCRYGVFCEIIQWATRL